MAKKMTVIDSHAISKLLRTEFNHSRAEVVISGVEEEYCQNG